MQINATNGLVLNNNSAPTLGELLPRVCLHNEVVRILNESTFEEINHFRRFITESVIMRVDFKPVHA